MILDARTNVAGAHHHFLATAQALGARFRWAGDWVHTAGGLFTGDASGLVEASVGQDARLYRSDAILVVAALWEYQLACHLNAFARRRERPHLDDAVQCLNEILVRDGRAAVAAAPIAGMMCGAL